MMNIVIMSISYDNNTGCGVRQAVRQCGAARAAGGALREGDQERGEYVCVAMWLCVCMCVREGQRVTESDTDREREAEIECVRGREKERERTGRFPDIQQAPYVHISHYAYTSRCLLRAIYFLRHSAVAQYIPYVSSLYIPALSLHLLSR